jgi:quercetin dioxygenase-like cupin family protein
MPDPVLYFPDLAGEAPHVSRGIHSQTLCDGPDLRLVLFAFAPGEELSEHTAARPAVVHVLDGEGDAIVGGEPRALAPGTWFRMPAGMAHSIHARTPLRMALYLLPDVAGPPQSRALGRRSAAPDRPKPDGQADPARGQ